MSWIVKPSRLPTGARARRIAALCLGLWVVSAVLPANGQQALNENCVVSVLNRTALVKPDGTWVLPNVPANFGQVRARATCVENGLTLSGQSDYFVIPANGSIDVPDIILGVVDPIPATLAISSPTLTLADPLATAQLTVTATFPGGTAANVTAAVSGTNYTVSNPAVATVSPDGLVTPVMSGTVTVSAMLEGTLGLIQLQVVFSGDSDGDGIPDDLEIAVGLNPDDPIDGLEDSDRDGLTNKEELIDFGTEFQIADTDSDGIEDGEEVVAGADGFITNPVVFDTDGDGIGDGLEVATGSNPTDATSFNLAAALLSLSVAPDSFVLTVNTITGEASRQLTVTGLLKDNTTIDLTSSAKGTNYSSSNLLVCNFGAGDGRVFAGNDGFCTVTATNNGFSASASVVVRSFAPTALSSLAIPGYANNVDVNDDFAYVAAGATGLQVVDAFDPNIPVIVGAVDTPGNANDVRVLGNLAYVADGSAGLQIIDVSNPSLPAILGAVDTPGEAQDVVVVGTRAYVADGELGGLQVIDVSNPAAPVILGGLVTAGTAKGVDVSGNLAVVADGLPSRGIRVIDVSDPAAMLVLGELPVSINEPKDLVVRDTLAYVAAFQAGFLVVDFSNPALPQVVGSLPGSNLSGFVARDVELSGRFALAAELLFFNAVPIVDIRDPANPIFRAILDFSPLGDYNGTGIALTPERVYMTGEFFNVSVENGTTGDTRLFIGQYLVIEDTDGIAPTVSLTAPADGDTVVEGTSVTVTADASDDIGVLAVEFLVEGEVAFTDTAAPYEFTAAVPLGVTTLSLGARAVDSAANRSPIASVSLNVIPDPLTTAVGLVVDLGNIALEGANVTCLDTAGITSLDGGFSIPGLPTLQGPIQCSAVFITAANETLTGTSAAVPPVPGGITDVGTITVRRARFETELGTNLFHDDDDSDFITFTQGFTFPFAGVARTFIFVNSNGNLTFDGFSGAGRFPNPLGVITGLARISPAFVDFAPGLAPAGGGVFVNQFADRFVVTWNRVPVFALGGENTFQLVLFADGRIQFGYNGMTHDGFGTSIFTDNTFDISVAVSPGGFPVPLTTVDYTLDAPFSIASGSAVLENFNTDGSFDLDGGFVLFRPNGTGGYDVDFIPPVPTIVAATANVEGLVINDFGDPLANCVVMIGASNDLTFSAAVTTGADGSFRINGVPVGGVVDMEVFNEFGGFMTTVGLHVPLPGYTYTVVVEPPPPSTKP